ncbi:MAG: alanine:cation symporter family protein [Oscillibacter sp.]|nr:alanine:cation symporter family protein [Oscillibacter sp.]
MLLGVGVLYTIISGCIQVRRFGYIMKRTLLRPFFHGDRQAAEKGTVTSFQALCTALASCVGSGNIIGVSTALIAGGLGAIFWMWVAAFVGMATKYGEIVLGVMYRRRDSEGQYVGGPFYYMEDGLHLKWLAGLCAAFMVTQIIGGNFIQSNAVSGVLHDQFHMPPQATAIALVVLIFVISAGGLKRLTRVAQRVTPFMATVYIVGGLLIILFNITKLPGVIVSIFTEAFGLRAVGGGALGAMTIAMQKGIARGLYSNEAGEGSAPVLHSSADVRHPVEQGIHGVTEVFVDTFVICTITGLVIGVTGVLDGAYSGNIMAIKAFASVWGPLGYVVSVSLLLFCFTSLMCQWYFGFVGLNYLFGFRVADKFKYIFPFFCAIGALLKLEMVWTIQDIVLALLTIPNLLALILLAPKVRKATKEYFSSDLYRISRQQLSH